ncbi:peptidoglycan-binding protein [bacterium]|nr:peptidoglycan-binding protein [bacterium]
MNQSSTDNPAMTCPRSRQVLRQFPRSWLLHPELPVRPGDRGPDVRLVQEWLCLHEIPTAIDGRFGPQSATAIETFAERYHLEARADVDATIFEALASPMIAALTDPASCDDSVPEAVVRIAFRQLGAREIGGPNGGPWVRLYMNGREGTAYPWCAGFVSFVIRRACGKKSESLPFKLSVSCDGLAIEARRAGRLVTGADYGRTSHLSPGSVFLIRRRTNDWVHCGIVTAFYRRHFDTIEGNTNADGSREGTAVLRRRRSYRDCDFIRLA